MDKPIIQRPERLKSAEEIAIWNGLDNHPELEDCVKAMEEYKNSCFKEAIKRVEEMLTDHTYVNVDAQCGLKNVLEILKEEINGR